MVVSREEDAGEYSLEITFELCGPIKSFIGVISNNRLDADLMSELFAKFYEYSYFPSIVITTGFNKLEE